MPEGSRMAIPPVKQTKINTQALISMGESLLIGGYYFEESEETESGVPVLSSIPIIGNLFKNSAKNSRRMERLVLITPRIISLDEARALPPQIQENTFARNPADSGYDPRPGSRPLSPGGCARKQ